MNILLKIRDFSLMRSPTTRALGALIIVFVIGLIFNADGAFLKWTTHGDMLRAVSVFGLLACGMTLVIITGGIDLSVGSILGVSAVSFSIFCIRFSWPFYIAIIACLLIGMICGSVSGLIIARFRIQPFIATLAMMVFARGFAKWISGGQKISTAVQQSDGTYKYVPVPEVFNFINSKILWNNISVVTIIFIICLLITAVLLIKLRPGRYIYAIGGNEEAARLSGVPVNAIKTLTYAMSGIFCAVAVPYHASQELSGDPQPGF